MFTVQNKQKKNQCSQHNLKLKMKFCLNTLNQEECLTLVSMCLFCFCFCCFCCANKMSRTDLSTHTDAHTIAYTVQIRLLHSFVLRLRLSDYIVHTIFVTFFYVHTLAKFNHCAIYDNSQHSCYNICYCHLNGLSNNEHTLFMRLNLNI